MATLTSKTVSGAAWSGASRLAIQLLSLLSTLTIAHILNPAAYGIFGLARTITAFFEIFRDLGISSAIIQRKAPTEEFLSSMFWMNLLLGFSAMSIIWAAAPFAASFYREPVLEPVLRTFSFCFVILGIAAVPAALLAREMSFQRIATIELISAVSSTSATIISALIGAGLWSLVIGGFTNVTVSSVLFCTVRGWRPRAVFAWREIRPTLVYSLNLSGSNVLEFLARNADNLIIGKFLGVTALGYYQLAYNLLLYSMQSTTQVLGRVLFPALVRLQDDDERLRAAYTRGVSAIATIIFPAMLGIMAVAQPFVRTVLGVRWLPAVPVLLILAPVGVMQCITMTLVNIYAVKARTDLLFRWGVLCSAVYLLSFFAGLPWGIAGVAAAYLIANALLFIPSLAIPFRLIGLCLADFLKPITPILTLSLLMLLTVWTATCVTHSIYILIPLGVIVYCAAGYRLLWPGMRAALKF